MSVEIWDHDELLGLASERIKALEGEAAISDDVIDSALAECSHLGGRIRRLHRWLRKSRVRQNNLFNVIAAYATRPDATKEDPNGQ